MAHQNPPGNWEHKGSFSVLLTDNAPMDIVPSNVSIEGHKVTVEDGLVYQAMGGIQCYSGTQPFRWGYRFLKEIRDGSGKLIWRNWDYKP